MRGFSSILENGLRAAGKEMAAAWQYSIAENFAGNGRPAWRSTHRGGSILRDTGRLSSSILVRSEQSGPNALVIVARTNRIPYARIHQYGGRILPKSKGALAIPLPGTPRGKRPADYGAELIFVKGKGGKAPTLGISKDDVYKPLFVLLKSVYVVARPFLVFQKEDRDTFRQILKRNTQ